jgi:hypothetical protein
MRLAQLARKLSIKQSEIIGFLATKQIEVQDSSNTRIEPDHMKLVVGHFAPSLLEEISAQSAEEERLEPARMPLEVAATHQIEPTVSAEAIFENTDLPIEVIKAPKVELQGLKVLGKIELPEAKKKEAAETKNETRPPRPQRDKRAFEQRDKRNPIALQREREEREAERKRQEKLKAEKELKTKRYLNKVKPQPSKPTRLVKEELEHVTEVEEPMPTSLLGRFWKWLRT